MAQILHFPTDTTPPSVSSPLAYFVRIGEAHKKLSDLHAAERLPASRVVVDASRLRYQRELIKSLQAEGAEIVLDTEAAELAALWKFKGHARNAPWAVPGSSAPLGPEYFLKGSKVDTVSQIAQFSVENNVDVVLAPAHFLGDRNFSHWFEIDRAACIRLRNALDGAGGKDIAIDYPLILSHVDLNDQQIRGTLVQGISDLPIDHLWVRASGLSSDVGPATLKRYVMSMGAMHNLGKPIIADHLGGLVGSAAMAFGVISGIAHGIGERERFDASSWHKAPLERSDDDEFGRAVRVTLCNLNKSFTLPELELLSKARGGRRIISCNDPNCCAHGYDDMINDPRSHAARQSFTRHKALQDVPDLRRARYFIAGPMTDAEREGKQIAQLKPSKADAARLKIDLDSLAKRLLDQSKRLSKSKTMLEALHEARGDEAYRARPAGVRRRASTLSREAKK